MPYIEGEERIFLEKDGYKLSYIEWVCKGQCVALRPSMKFRVNFLTAGVKIDIEARSQHKAKRIAHDIAELFNGSV